MSFLFLLPLLILLAGPDLISGCAVGALYLGLGWYLTKKSSEKFTGSLRYPLLSAALSLAAGARFFFCRRTSALFPSMESLPLMPAERICGIAAAVLSLLSVFGMDMLLSALAGRFLRKIAISETLRENLYLALTSSAVITLASKCSPLYAFNDWVDPHTMFSVGKGILHGMLPYRDIFEQKGPLILLFHSLGAVVSFDTLHGIWILEIVCCFFFLYFSWRILKSRFGLKALSLLPFLALLVYTPISFDQGDSAEELCLPLLTYALWVGWRALSAEKLPEKKDWFLIGVTSGCVLWIKYSMLGFYLGWFLAFFLFARSQKRGRELLSGLGWIAAGVGSVSLPVLLWFLLAGGLGDLFSVYFYQNMFLYPKTADLYGRFALFRNLVNGLLNFGVFSTPIFIADLVGLFWSRKKESRSLFRLFLYSFLLLFFVIYFTGRFYTYYSLIFGVFSVYGLAAVCDFLQTNLKGRFGGWDRNTLAAAALCTAVIGVFICSGNMRTLGYQEEDYMQFKARELIEASGIESPTLLNYGFLDMGVNTAAGLIPNQRFFCSFNIPLSDIQKEQDACLKNGCTDFVLTFMLELDSENYELLAHFPSNYSFGPIRPGHNLYQKINR